MASLTPSSPGKPLRLKDFLDEDTNSDSTAGFWTVPRRLPDQTVRYLLAAELGKSVGGDRSLKRCRSKGALTKITAVINAVKMLPFASSSSTGCGHNCNKPLPRQGGFLSRSFSRKLRRSFWRKRERRVENNAVRTIVTVKDIVRLRSFGDESRGVEVTDKTGPRSPPSPVRSTNSGSASSSGGGGGWSDTDSAGSDSFCCGSSVCCGGVKDGSPNMDANHCGSPPSPYTVRGAGEDSISKSTCYRDPKVKEEETGGGQGIGCPCHFEEEKDQLSPVSVLDFPFEEDDNDEDEGVDVVDAERAEATAASPTSFHRSLANLERTKHQLLQKIREFESLAALVDPVDLDARFAASSEDALEQDGREDRAVHEVELREGDQDDDADEVDDQLLQFQVEIEERAFALLRELRRRGGGSPGKKAGGGGSIDELLVDFFIERLSCRRDDVGVQIRMKRRFDRTAGKAEEDEDEQEALLRAAEDWIGGRRLGVEAHGWGAEVREMEIDRRWRCAHVEEEEEEIAGDLGGRVLESLVEELLVDLFQYN